MLEEILRGPLSYHTVAAPALEPFDSLDADMREVALAIRLDPSRSELHAAIGNGLVRKTRYLEAIEAYRAAVAAEPSNAAALLALSELMHLAHDRNAQLHLRRALEHQRVYRDPRPHGGRLSAMLLVREAPYSVNAPLELIVDAERVALHKYYVEDGRNVALPAFDVLFCAFGYAYGAQRALDASEKLIERLRAPVVNRPSHLVRAARERLRSTLAGISGVTVPDIRTATPNEIPSGEPLLVRPVDTQAGIGLALVRNAQELRAHQARWPAALYHVAPFIDYAGDDGYYRKYRIVIVDGVPYPYHLAISPRWMVHYRTAPMAEHAWMREEEAAFLANPHAVFPDWSALADVSKAIALDYVGIDCTRLPDGSMLIFEADPAMLVHDEDAAGVFSYKRSAASAIRDALTAAIAARAASASGRGRTRAT